ncbi:MAG: hypothetical protein DSY79_03220, partial [Chloroflexi bacterium]
MNYMDYQFGTDDKKAHFLPAPWTGLPEPVEKLRGKHKFWINNGRANHIWQTAFHDKYQAFRNERYPMAPIEMNPVEQRLILAMARPSLLERVLDASDSLGIRVVDVIPA